MGGRNQILANVEPYEGGRKLGDQPARASGHGFEVFTFNQDDLVKSRT